MKRLDYNKLRKFKPVNSCLTCNKVVKKVIVPDTSGHCVTKVEYTCMEMANNHVDNVVIDHPDISVCQLHSKESP